MNESESEMTQLDGDDHSEAAHEVFPHQKIKKQKAFIICFSFLIILIVGSFVSLLYQKGYLLLNQEESSSVQYEKTNQNDGKFEQQVQQVQKTRQANHSCSNLTSLINKEVLLLRSLQGSKHKYTCNHLIPTYDQYDPQNNQLYYLAAYQTFLQGCDYNKDHSHSVHKQNIIKWNGDRASIEWGILNLQRGDTVVVNRPNHYNLLELILLSKLVGSAGSVWVVGLIQSPCFLYNMDLHNISNIYSIAADDWSKQNSSKYVIQNFEDTNDSIEVFMEGNKDFNIFVMEVKQIDVLQQLRSRYSISKYKISRLECETTIVNEWKQGGAYELKRLQMRTKKLDQAIKEQSQGYLALLQTRYNLYKQQLRSKTQKRYQYLLAMVQNCTCIDVSTNRVFPDFVITVYGSRLYGVTQHQVASWEYQRQAIQWVRSKAKPNDTIYYEFVNSFNLLAICEIARILKRGNVIVYCSDEECSLIEIQILKSGLDNIMIQREFGHLKAGQANAVITNNQILIQNILQTNQNQQNMLILAYFTKIRKSSWELFAKLIGTHQIQRISLPLTVSECVGLTYTHYFWGLDEKFDGFYQISPTKYAIFTFWSGSPRTIPYRRRYVLEEIINKSKVQVKIINNQIFTFLQSQEIPIHKAFQYLSGTHQSDYARAYLMYFYGGGYTDSKHTHFDWNPYFEMLEENPNIFAVGYAQKQAGHVACHDQHGPPSCSVIRSKFSSMIGNGLYIYKKKSDGEKELMNQIHQILDKKLDRLIENPPRSPRDKLDSTLSINGRLQKSKYPLRWAEINGELTSRICFRNQEKYILVMPFPITKDYLSL